MGMYELRYRNGLFDFDEVRGADRIRCKLRLGI